MSTTTFGIKKLLEEGISGDQSAVGELRTIAKESPELLAPAALEHATSLQAKTLAGTALRLAKHAVRWMRQQPEPKAPQPKILQLQAGQPVNVASTTLARLGVPIEDVVEIAGNQTGAVYQLNMPGGAGPIINRSFTGLMLNGELVNLEAGAPTSAEEHYADNGHPMRHNKFDAVKWNRIYADYLAGKRENGNLPSKSSVSKKLDALALRAIAGKQVVIVTHEYSGHGKEVGAEIVRRAKAGVPAPVITPAPIDMGYSGMSAQHWLDDAEMPDEGVQQTPRWFDWRRIVTLNDHGNFYLVEYKHKSYALAIDLNGKLYEVAPKLVQRKYGHWKQVWVSSGPIWIFIQDDCDEPKDVDNWKMLFQPVIQDWFEDEPDGGGYKVIERGRSLKRTIQSGKPGFDRWPARYAPSDDGKFEGYYIPLAKRDEFAAKIEAKFVEEERAAIKEKRQPVLPKDGMRYLSGASYHQDPARQVLVEMPGSINGSKLDDHVTAFFTPSEEEAIYAKIAVLGGSEYAADLVRMGWTPEAACKAELGFTEQTPELDRVYKRTAKSQDDKLASKRQIEVDYFRALAKKGGISEGEIATLAHNRGLRDIFKTNGKGDKWVMSAQAQFLEVSKWLLIEKDGIALDDEAQRKTNNGKVYTFYEPLPPQPPTPARQGNPLLPPDNFVKELLRYYCAADHTTRHERQSEEWGILAFVLAFAPYWEEIVAPPERHENYTGARPWNVGPQVLGKWHDKSQDEIVRTQTGPHHGCELPPMWGDVNWDDVCRQDPLATEIMPVLDAKLEKALADYGKPKRTRKVAAK